ncbi:chlorophyll A-B binding protein [Aureococcus anophagefferens]|nr:chlorophyll A-B binding protein [Aureococcus anophagefferens]
MALKVAILLPLAAALKVSTGPPAREMAPTLVRSRAEKNRPNSSRKRCARLERATPSQPKAMEMAGIGLETGGQIWDPAGFATFSDESLTWCGAASRAIARRPLRLGEGALGGKLQILAWAFCVELYSEMQKPHYLKGGDFVTYDWAKQADGKSPAELLRKQNAELKNGRLAMIGILGFFASANIPGAVPMVPH